jgi:hypothetical protein
LTSQTNEKGPNEIGNFGSQAVFNSILNFSHPLQVEKRDEVDVEVSWDDQQNINLFSKLNVKYGFLEDEIKQKEVIRVWNPATQ